MLNIALHETAQTVFQSNCTIFHSQQEEMRVPFALHSNQHCQYLVLSV